jgi:hypothetical protein
MNDELFDEKIAVLNHDAGCSLFYSGGCTCDLNARRAKVEAKIEKHDATVALTDEQYVEVLATVKRRDVGVLAGYLHVSRWCDGSTACAVTSEPHGHWRGAYSVRSADVIVRLLDENERLREKVDEAAHALQGVAEYDSDPEKSWTLTKEACRDALTSLRGSKT